MSKTYIIAEAGVNHNGDPALAFKLVDAAVAAGADAVKFQTFNSEQLVTKSAPVAKYQEKNQEGVKTQLEILRSLELDDNIYFELQTHCVNKNIDFLSTAFDFKSLDFLVLGLGLERLKVSSGDLNNSPFLLAHAQAGLPIILSTGMSQLQEVQEALGVLAFGYLSDGSSKPSESMFVEAFNSTEGQKFLRDKVTLLHCTSEYPAPLDEINLRAMDTLRHAFNLPVGLSDHSEGIVVPIAAAARGAAVIEKHFTLDKSLPGPDHKASIEPEELTNLVSSVRVVERALGDGTKTTTESEEKNKFVVRKSLVASRDIHIGEVFSEQNLAVKRPGNGRPPIDYWSLIGKPSSIAYVPDALIEE